MVGEPRGFVARLRGYSPWCTQGHPKGAIDMGLVWTALAIIGLVAVVIWLTLSVAAFWP